MKCQSCGNSHLEPIIDLGYLPPPNDYRPIGTPAKAQTWMPTPLVFCNECELVQLGIEIDQKIVFPPEYPYTSGTTKLLRDNFADLAKQLEPYLRPYSVVMDIGSNDGTLLSNFSCKRLGIEPTNTAEIAIKNGINTMKYYFTESLANQIHDRADVITCCNCFAHVPDPNDFMRGVSKLLKPEGVFVTESHYLIDLLKTTQYDTIYHEHYRYYSLRSIRALLDRHGFKIFKVQFIPTHGGSIRVFSGNHAADASVDLINKEKRAKDQLASFAEFVKISKRHLLKEIIDTKSHSQRIVGIGAPSRASTVVNYCRLDESMIDYVAEVDGSLKLNKYMPGTNIPVINEREFFRDQPDYALIFSWHIAEEIQTKLRAKGFKGEFILPI